MTFKFFCFQVLNASISNIIGTVLGHPLDTIRVSIYVRILNYKVLSVGKFCDFSYFLMRSAEFKSLFLLIMHY